MRLLSEKILLTAINEKIAIFPFVVEKNQKQMIFGEKNRIKILTNVHIFDIIYANVMIITGVLF